MKLIFGIDLKAAFLTCGLLLAWSGTYAADCDNSPGGLGLDSAQASYVCAEKMRKSSDVKLNQIYKRLLGAVKSDPDAGGDVKAELISAQKAWIAFRDAECELIVSISGGAQQWVGNFQASCRLNE
ncbi:lysozyme inhibitor LprI family protein [Burkholderia gladioli]|uniref:lysozyme inhibitor LprI family protein n=1 Tax=Burkholderia gladioli TaxID=28095 RepID=UPI00163FF235|nr:lysozyme inhibitor LprI family protein [Burkholderia gladioli]